MGENEQILDVTYGNFSCRLEGFEDSVETMKLVVSFFHELAGHDRFMDVAPQAPDMATLARLTEEQTGAEVDIAGDGNKVSLRLHNDDVKDNMADDDTSFDTAFDDPDTEESITLSHDEDADDDALMEDGIALDDADDRSAAIDHDASVADKLERIRAVTKAALSTDEEAAYAEDLTDPAPVPRAANPLAQRLADLAKRSSQTRILDASEQYAESDALHSEDAMTADEDEDYFGQDDSDLLEDDAEDDLAEVEEDAPVAGVDALAQAEVPAESEEDETDFPRLDASRDDDETADDLDAALDADAEDPAEDEAAELPENTLFDTQDADDADDAVQEPERAPVPDRSTLVLTYRDVATDDDTTPDGDDDDFDLRKEVAKVEAEIAARQGNAVARHGLPRSVDDAMSRIMSQTDQHLNKPESRRHRDAFAQLKAAVAATEAARQLGDEGDKAPDPDEVFKDDLGAHDAEEKSQSATPLKLVRNDKADEASHADEALSDQAEEQDDDIEEAPASVRPARQETSDAKPLDAASARLRSIAEMKEAEGVAATTGFAEFAKAQGAVELAELLEAAGAYLCFVEGEDDFSRPQVMKVVQSASKEEISREDGLRYFGRLLRQSKLIKLSNGRFRVSGNTQYRPDDDRAAQG